MIKAALYLILLLGLAAWAFVSRDCRSEEEAELSPFLRIFQRMAVHIWQRLKPVRQKIPGLEEVRADLRLLHPSRRVIGREDAYYTGKIRNLLLFVCAADLLAAAVFLGGQTGRILENGRRIERNSYGGSDRILSLTAMDPGRTDLGRFDLQVSARRYRQEDVIRMADDLTEKLPDLILAHNPDLLHVSTDLSLVSAAEGYPFILQWDTSSYSLVNTNGEVHPDNLENGTPAKVRLRASLKYDPWVFETEIPVTVVPRSLTEEEAVRQSIEESLAAAETSGRETEACLLPDRAGGISLTWRENRTDLSPAVLLGVLAAGAAGFFLTDRDLRKSVDSRKREMDLDYPHILSKFVLYLGAGMSVRSVFQKLAADYRLERERGAGSRYIQEEILLVCHELDSGIPEITVYGHFGQRCRSRQYTRFCSLLTQNLKKGNSALLDVLQEESAAAFEERRNIARELGEEAGTKLLFPMIIMLAVTMLIIIVPAYYGFM